MKNIDADDFIKLLSSGKAINILDVRNTAEHKEVHLTHPHKHIPIDMLEREAPFDENEEIYILCGGGGRAAKAAQKLTESGYVSAIVVKGGLRGCIANGADISGTDIKSAVTCKS